jgi:hypothetical protein
MLSCSELKTLTPDSTIPLKKIRKAQVGDQQSMITQPFAHRASSLILAT